MAVTLVLFLVGFYILVKGAKTLVRGAVSLARFLHVPPWVVGAVIVGVGTSLPEFAITIASSFDGNTIGLGTIIGSNTFNLLGILGITALIAPFSFKHAFIKQDFLVNAAAILVTVAVAYLAVFGDASFAGITRPEAFFLLLLFVGWVRFNMVQHDTAKGDDTQENATVVVSSLLILAGLVGVIIGGAFVVDGAETLAQFLGVSDTLIALLIIGPGTSLPELSVTVAAALRRESGLAIGNIIGSNIFDFWGILGAAALFSPIAFPSGLLVDALVTFGAVLLIMTMASRTSPPRLSRRHGLLFLAVYAAYLVFLGVRG